MFVTRPLSGDPRELRQLDAAATNPSGQWATAFALRSALPDRPDNQSYSDNLAVIPDALGLGAEDVGAGGFTPNDIFISQGLTVHRTSGSTLTADWGQVPETSLCTSPNSDLLFDRWGIQFGGQLILTCTGSNVLEIWKFSSGGTASLVRQLTGAYTGRADFVSPNFAGCSWNDNGTIKKGGCLGLVADDSVNVTLVNGGGQDTTIPTGLSAASATNGRRIARSVPSRVYQFQTSGSGGCLFGTVPANNEITQFPCSTFPNVFQGVDNGDLLIFTPSGLVARVNYLDVNPRGSFVRRGNGPTLENAGTYEDLAFPSLRLVGLAVHQPAVGNPNQGVQGQIIFYILGAEGFNPQTDVDVQSLRFGRTGTEPSVTGCSNVGNDWDGNGYPDLKCNAAQSIALCDEVNYQCIVTGFTENPSAFEGD